MPKRLGQRNAEARPGPCPNLACKAPALESAILIGPAAMNEPTRGMETVPIPSNKPNVFGVSLARGTSRMRTEMFSLAKLSEVRQARAFSALSMLMNDPAMAGVISIRPRSLSLPNGQNLNMFARTLCCPVAVKLLSDPMEKCTLAANDWCGHERSTTGALNGRLGSYVIRSH